MKRLYHCQAWHDENGLISYKTRVIEFKRSEFGISEINYFNYRSITTLQHIRKYIYYLIETGKSIIASYIEEMYNMARDKKIKKLTLNFSKQNFITKEYWS